MWGCTVFICLFCWFTVHVYCIHSEMAIRRKTIHTCRRFRVSVNTCTQTANTSFHTHLLRDLDKPFQSQHRPHKWEEAVKAGLSSNTNKTNLYTLEWDFKPWPYSKFSNNTMTQFYSEKVFLSLVSFNRNRFLGRKQIRYCLYMWCRWWRYWQ